jgi:hypothetical protein
MLNNSKNMYIDFETLHPESRVWIYQANRPLSESETVFISDYLKSSVANWAAHGVPLQGSFKIESGRFVVVAADESFNNPSGCSIDASTHWFKDLGQTLNIDFFDRSQAYVEDQELKFFPILQGKKQVESGLINADTLLINNMVTDLRSYYEKRMIKASESHLKRFFINQNA